MAVFAWWVVSPRSYHLVLLWWAGWKPLISSATLVFSRLSFAVLLNDEFGHLITWHVWKIHRAGPAILTLVNVILAASRISLVLSIMFQALFVASSGLLQIKASGL